MNDFDNFMQGKDWIMTITVPNRFLKLCPDKVNELQNAIQFALLKFNADVKAEVGEKAEIKKTANDGIILDDEQKLAIVNKMNADEEKRRGGGRL